MCYGDRTITASDLASAFPLVNVYNDTGTMEEAQGKSKEFSEVVVSDSIRYTMLITVLDRVQGSVSMEATFIFIPTDPYAVYVEFERQVGQTEPVVWCFARQLIKDGIRREVGFGDILVRPEYLYGSKTGAIIFVLSNEQGQVLSFHAKREDINTFLNRSHKAVPIGGESDIAQHALELYLKEHVYFAA